MPISNYTTTVPTERSMMEIQKMLAKAGANGILIEYDAEYQPSALSFRMTLNGQPLSFRLPGNYEGIIRSLKRDGVKGVKLDPAHARRVAWRIIHDWVRAQLALVDAEQATLAEVMLPYVITNTGRTLYQEIENRPGLLQLPSA